MEHMRNSFQKIIQKILKSLPCRLAKLKEHQGVVDKVVLSPDGQVFATYSIYNKSGRYPIQLWDLQGNLLAELKGHKGVIDKIVFSSDGQ